MRREILRPDQTFFFATTLELEQGQRSSRHHANDVGRVQELRKTRIFGTCRIVDWMRKFNFLDDEKVKREKEKKIEAGHRTSLLHKHFFAHLYSNVSSGLLNYQDSRYTTSSTYTITK